jgi:hypothetical protein
VQPGGECVVAVAVAPDYFLVRSKQRRIELVLMLRS